MLPERVYDSDIKGVNGTHLRLIAEGYVQRYRGNFDTMIRFQEIYASSGLSDGEVRTILNILLKDVRIESMLDKSILAALFDAPHRTPLVVVGRKIGPPKWTRPEPRRPTVVLTHPKAVHFKYGYSTHPRTRLFHLVNCKDIRWELQGNGTRVGRFNYTWLCGARPGFTVRVVFTNEPPSHLLPCGACLGANACQPD